MKKTLLKPLSLIASALFWCAWNLHAQTAPTITTQPASQTNLLGTTVTFSVAVNGTGPFTYQWQFNGTNLPNNIITSVANLSSPYGIAFDGTGNLFIACYDNRVRKMDTNGVITTVAGTGVPGFSGDNGFATNASFNSPQDVVVDKVGNLFIADLENYRIRKIGTNGIVTTVAGNGGFSYAGDGGAATNAAIDTPSGLALDNAGNLFITCYFESRVRKVDTNGIITTVAGNGSAGYSGDGGAATNAGLHNPQDVTVDTIGNLFIANFYGQVRKVNTSGIIMTVAGNLNGSSGYSGDGGMATNALLNDPESVKMDGAGNLLIADAINNRIRKVDTSGIITTVAGNGLPAELNNPSGLAIDIAGNLFIADFFNSRIREVHFAGYPTLVLTNVSATNAGNYTVVITSPYGSVTSSVAVLNVPAAIITQQPTNQVVTNGGTATFSVAVNGTGPFTYQWLFNGSSCGIITTVAGNGTQGFSGDGGLATNAEFEFPIAVTKDNFGNLYIVDNSRIRKMDTNGIITTVAGNGTYGFSGDGGPATNAALYGEQSVTVDRVGNFFIADCNNNRIRKVDTNGIITTVVGNGTAGFPGDGVLATNASLNYPACATLDNVGNLFIADEGNYRIRKVDTNGIITTVAGNGTNGYSGDGGPATNAMLNHPGGVTVDGFGNLFIEEGGNRIRKVDINGIITTVAGNGTNGYSGDGGSATNAMLNSSGLSYAVTLDSLGNMFIPDFENGRIREVGTNGIITTVAGNGTVGYSGDGGAATSAALDYPPGVVVDSSGDLFIADDFNRRIRKVVMVTLSYLPTFTLTVNNITTNNIGNYSVIVSSSAGSVTSSVAVLYMPPFITVQPANQQALAGNNPSFSVAAFGSGSLDYEWYFGGTNLIQSGTNSTIALHGVTANNAGNYTVVVTNSCGSVTSQVAILTVVPLVITVQPASQIASVGSSPSFSVGVAGAGPFGYEWYFAATNLVQNGTNNTLTLPSISTNNAGNYMVVVTNAYGSVTSQVATLTMALPPMVTIQPSSQTNLPGTAVSFSVTVGNAGPFTYQWQFNGTNFPNNIISTVAGNGSATYAGDGGTAINASLHSPWGVVFDASGNMFIADESNNRIRKVNTNGIISTIAGNGSATYAGDGGQATNASLYFPTGIAFDATGNLYIADYANYRIRKVDTNGIITTVAGSGSYGFSGDGGAATNASLANPIGVACDVSGDVCIADYYNNRIRKVDTNGIITTVAGKNVQGFSEDGGAATNASLYYPYGVACGVSGNVYIADHYNDRIRKVDTNGIITTMAGGVVGGFVGDGGTATNASLNEPEGVACDVFGNLYIADTYDSRIRKVDTSGIITTLVGKSSSGYSGDGGAATNATLYYPSGVASDATGNLYIADTVNARIRKVLLYAGYPTFTLNNIGASNAGNYSVVITSPYGSVTSQVATLAVAFSPTIAIQPFSQTNLPGTTVNFNITAIGTGPFTYQWLFNGTNLPNNIITTVAGNGSNGFAGDGGLATSGSLHYPNGVTFDAFGNLYVADYDNNRIRKVATNGIIITVAGKNNRGYSGDGGAATNASLQNPSAVAFDASGNLYIADTLNCRIRKVGTNRIIITVAGNGSYGYSGDGGAATNAGLYYPVAVVFDSLGNLYIADQDNNRIRKVDTNGIITTVAGNGPTYPATGSYSGDGGAATNASLYYPSGVAFDVIGNFYIADNGNNRIRKVATNGIITTVAGNGSRTYAGDGGAATNASLYWPSGVTFDSSGNLYIADYGNNRIREVATNGIITSVAGSSASGYFGDGGAATNAGLYNPSSVAFNFSGNMYIADSANNRIRAVSFAGYPTNLTLLAVSALNAGSYTVVVTSSYGSVTSVVALLTVAAPAIITSQPASQLAAVGSSPSFSVAVAGSGPFGYEWFFAGTNLIQAGTNSSLMLPGISTNNAGNYTVVITNAYGSVTSAIATLTVAALPTITVQPTSLVTAVGSSASFSVSVIGSGPFGYEWFFAGTNLVQSGTNSTLTLASITTNNAGSYMVVITNIIGSATSQVATLTVGFPPLVATQPASQTNLAGTAVSFSVAVTGTGPFTYQWQFNGTNLPNNIITTVAGNGTNGYSGDGGPATSANLYGPACMAFDSFGNLYFADQSNNRIRKVDTNGVITTVAGNGPSQYGSGGYSGDGGLATNAALGWPPGIAVDGVGNLFIADRNNGRIRKVDTNGIITTVAGEGSGGTFGGAATNLSLGKPEGVALDNAGNLFFADGFDNAIFKVDTNDIITSVAGNGGAATNAWLNQPWGLALDNLGNLFIADTFSDRVRKVATNGVITTVAGNGSAGYSGDGGAAPNAMLDMPSSVALDHAGNLFIAENANACIRKVDTNGLITTVAGQGQHGGHSGDGGAATNAMLNGPRGVALDNAGNLFIGDFFNNRIREVHFAGYPTLVMTNVSATNAGNYSVVITSPYGSVTSSIATLTVDTPPFISTQPQNRTAPAGGSTNFNVTAGGTPPLNYQWWMTASPQSNATAVPVVYYGFVVAASITSGGAGYLSVPQVQIVGGSGSGAAGYAMVSNRMVTVISMTNAGYGYSTPPTIQIDAPSAISVPSQSNATLILPAVTTDNMGNYFVVVTNNYGGVTSAIATLTVTIPPPQIITGGTNFGFATNGSGFGFNLNGAVGQTIVVDGSTNLLNWTPLFTNTVGTNSVYFLDSTSTNFPGRFYRARLQ